MQRLLAVTALALSLWGCAGARRGEPGAPEVLRAEDRRVVDAALRDALRSPDAGLRARAFRALGRMRLPGERARLEAALRDPGAEVRGAAATGLALLADPASVPALTEAASDPDASVRAQVLEALGQAAATLGLDAVRAALADGDPAVARAAARASWRLADGLRSADALAAAARSGPAEVRRAAAYALGRLAAAGVGPPSSGSTPPVPEEAERARVRDRLLPLVGDPDVEVRMQVARGLARPARPVEAEALASLSEDEEPRVRVHAARSLAWEGGPIEPYLDRLLRDDDPLVIHAALEGLGRIGTPEARALLIAAVTGSGPGWLRAVALDTLAALAEDLARRRALELQDTEDLRLRAAAARALGAQMPDRLLTDPQVPVRAAAVSALAAHDPFDARLASVASGGDPILRASLAEALGAKLPDGDRGRILSRLRSLWDASGEDEVPDARDTILDAAGKAGRDPAARALLAAGLTDRDWLVRRRAAEVLGRVFEEDHAGAVGAAAERPIGDYAAILRWAASPHRAVFRLEKGSFTVSLACEQAPLTCLSFACLAGGGFYDGLALHRVVPSFVIQDGDPRGDGSGGPGWSIRDEVGMPFVPGTLGMASAGYDTPGSQWFVTSSAQPHLDLRYTAFGTVTEGFALVPTLHVGDRVRSIRVDGATAAPCGPDPRSP